MQLEAVVCISACSVCFSYLSSWGFSSVFSVIRLPICWLPISCFTLISNATACLSLTGKSGICQFSSVSTSYNQPKKVAVEYTPRIMPSCYFNSQKIKFRNLARLKLCNHVRRSLKSDMNCPVKTFDLLINDMVSIVIF